MSKGDKEEFKRLRQEHARLHDPAGMGSSLELVPEREGASESRAPAGGTVLLEPAEIARRLDAFYDRGFGLTAPGARKVELVWRSAGGGGGLGRAVLDHVRQDYFAATVGLEDGEYLFAYEVDGRTAPDPRHAQRLLLSHEGAFTPLRLERYAETLSVRNTSAADKNLRVETDTPWLTTGAELELRPGREERVTLRFLPELMVLGENRGELGVTVSGDEEPDHLAVPVRAELVAGGAVPDFTYSPADLGALVQGRAQARLEVAVEARGRGALRGMITLAHTSEVADFLLDAEGGPRRFSYVFDLDSARLPCRERGFVTVTLVTDCYLADRRLVRAEVPYRLTYLNKSLPVMNFGAVRPGRSKTMRLEVTRSDGEETELEVALPDSARPHLECRLARPGVCIFRFRAPALPPGAPFAGDVSLTDRRSGLRDRIRFEAEVAGGDGGCAGLKLRASTARS